MDSISFTAERLIDTLYFSTSFQNFNDVYIRQDWLSHPAFESSKILSILNKA